MKKIKVSVIVPVYNVEDYLDDCLKSIVNQTLKDIEIIIVNDGSPDNSQKIIDDYVKKYPKLIKSFIKENGGQGSARNLGIEHSNGEYLSFIDSDDFIDKHMLEEMYSCAIKNNSDVVVCDMIDYFYDGRSILHNCTKFKSVFDVTPSASNKIFKKTFVNDLRFLSKVWYEDYNYTIKVMLKKPRISCISKPFYCCNVRKESTMNNKNALKNLDIIFTTNNIIDYSKENNCYDKNLISYLIYKHILFETVKRLAYMKTKDSKIAIKKIREYCNNNISDYKKMEFYKDIPRNVKLIANLNYIGLENIGILLLNIKSKLKGE